MTKGFVCWCSKFLTFLFTIFFALFWNIQFLLLYLSVNLDELCHFALFSHFVDKINLFGFNLSTTLSMMTGILDGLWLK